jgi:ferric-dicitrate binding protein FerR (iron transport regulator)
VARDGTRPFVIDAGKALVEVLGTSFNVNAYRKNPVVEITVESGMVALTPKQDQSEQIVLKAGNSGTFNKESKQLELISSSDPNNISWKTKELYFENSSLQEVADLISDVYNEELVILNQELTECPITVTFKNQSLDAILNVLEATMDLEISRTNGQITLDGTGCVE